MPKIPKTTKKGKPAKSAIPTMREFADRLERLQSAMTVLRDDMRDCWEVLYTTGLADVGPAHENEDDIPF